MAGLDWFTEEALLRAREIYESFHPEAREDKNNLHWDDKEKQEEEQPCSFPFMI